MIGQERWGEMRRLYFDQRVGISGIARMLDLDRKTVRRCVRGHEWRAYRREPRIGTLLSAHEGFLRARAPQVGYSARILHQELRRERGYGGSYETVKRFVAPLRELDSALDGTQLRFETPAGVQSQIDWGEAKVDFHSGRRVVHLAAQAGVRYAAENPHVYVSSNVTGFLHVLEGSRRYPVEHLVFASTSSVYGANTKMPFSEHDSTEHPLTLYAATKKANEMMAHSYAHLYGIPCTGLRFFTVYGPWGRPDMALFLFTRAIVEGLPIKVFNGGQHTRSFTYIDDIVEGVLRTLDTPPCSDETWNGQMPDPSSSGVAPYRVFNIGNEEQVPLMQYIEVLEQCLGIQAQKEMLPLQAGDVPATAADVSGLYAAVQYRPQVSVADGIAKFVEWYRAYDGIK